MRAESYGISDAGIALADKAVLIPMMGMTESFNVSVAATIILMEAMFQRCRLDAESYPALLFRWSHPQIRDFCDKNHLAYPLIREDGEVDNPSQGYASARELLATR